MAARDAESFRDRRPKYVLIHRPDADVEYMNALLREITAIDQDVLVVVAVGETKTGGQIAMSGPITYLKDLSPE